MREPGESVLDHLRHRGQPAPAVRLADPQSPSTRSEGRGRSGRFEIRGELGRGGIGIVWRGHDADIGRDVALKVLQESYSRNPEVVQRFLEEAQITGQLQHPGIVPVYELGMDGALPFFAMKLVKGRTLAKLFAERADAATDRRRFLALFSQACDAVAYAHARGVVHRDLKPANIMVGAFGEVQVLDWGFAKVLARGGVADERLSADVTRIEAVEAHAGAHSQFGVVMGSPPYMSPEQALGRVHETDRRSDVFSLGAILCELLTGRPPYAGSSEEILECAAQARLGEAHARLDACRADQELVALARRCLSPLPQDRPRDAKAVGSAVTAHLAAADERVHRATVSAAKARLEADGARTEALEQRRARRQTIVLAVAVLLALGLGSGGYLWNERREQQRIEETSQAVSSALREGQRLQHEERWAEAAAAAEQAAQLARSALSTELLARSTELLSAIEVERARAAAGARLLATLAEIRARWGDEFDLRHTDADYASAFLEAGLEPLTSGAAETAEKMRAYGRARTAEILPALDNWAWMRKNELGLPFEALVDLAARLDTDDDRARLRAAAFSKEWNTFVVEANARRAKAESPATGLLLGNALLSWNEASGAAAVLNAVALRHPGEFWIQLSLGNALEKVDPASAANAYASALALRPQSIETRHRLGIVLGQCGENELAISVWQGALDLAPHYTHLLAHIGNVRADPQEAIRDLEEARRRQPDDSFTHDCLARRYLEIERLEEARTSCLEAIRLGGRYAVAHARLSWVLDRLGDAEGARREAEASIEIDGKCSEGHHALAGCLMREKRFEEAAAEYRCALDLEKFHTSWYGLMQAQLEGGHRELVLETYREGMAYVEQLVLVQAAFARVYLDLGMGASDAKYYDEAIAAFRAALVVMPHLASAHMNLGNACSSKEQFQEAEDAYRAAVRHDPKLVLAHFNLGVFLANRGRVEEAIEAYEMALLHDPAHRFSFGNLGGLLIQVGQLDYAIDVLKRLVRANSKDAAGWGNLGLAYYRSNRIDEAVEALRTSIHLAPEVVTNYENLGLSLDQLGRWDESLELYRKGVELDPSILSMQTRVASRLMRRGQFEEALVELSRVPREALERDAALRAGCEENRRVSELAAFLDDMLAGRRAPESELERTLFARCCLCVKQYSTGVRLFREAFAKEPALLEDLAGGHRYAAAFTAALAGTREEGLEEAERADFRGQALAWLSAELAARKSQLATDRAGTMNAVGWWFRDADFRGVREPELLAALPEAERAAWARFWQEAAAVAAGRN